MIDWLTLIVPFRHAEGVFGGATVGIGEDGDVQWQIEKFRSLEGSWESSVAVKTHFRRDSQAMRERHFGLEHQELWISGNPAKWFQGHNAWGADNLPALAPLWARSVVEALGGVVDPFTYARWESGHFQIDRVDVCQMIDLGAETNVPESLNVLAHSASVVNRGRGNVTHGTVSFGKRSGRRTVGKFYDKFKEMGLASHAPVGGLPWRQDIIDWTRGKLRAEWEIHSRELEARGLRQGANWHADTAGIVWSELMEKLTVSAQAPVNAVDLDKLPRAVRKTYAAWESGNDLRLVMSRATWFRHRQELLPYGIDIGAPRELGPDGKPLGRAVVVDLPKVIKGSIAALPDWAAAGFYGQRVA